MNCKKRKLGSSFVACPLNCGQHIAIDKINFHLDFCLARQESLNKRSNHVEVVSSHTLNANGSPVSKVVKNHGSNSHINQLNQSSTKINTTSLFDNNAKRSESEYQFGEKTLENKDSKTHSENVFEHMMKRSKFSKAMRQRFHLHSLKGDTSWSTVIPDDSIRIHENNLGVICWHGSTFIKATSHGKEHPLTKYKEKSIVPYRDLELVISSSVPSWRDENFPKSRKEFSLKDDQTRLGYRLVQKHSALTVPVLKSMLQKLVRRRRPLPAVRVAMELVDKSWSDLIRRLPIIILEDCTLHPDMPLLVWLMVADSKGFQPPLKLTVKVLRIIFEIASCPWKDFLSTNQSLKHDPCPLDLNLDTQLMNQELQQVDHHGAELSIRAMLLRKQYGGMHCDMQMLTHYVKLWKERCQNNKQLSKGLIGLQHDLSESCKWVDLPTRIYHSLSQKSESYVERTFFEEGNGLCKLSFSDLCLAGVDFHCTNIIDVVLNKTNEKVRNHIMCLMSKNEKRDFKINNEKEETLERFLKSCMWNYHSGVNLRRPLIQTNDFTKEIGNLSDETTKQNLWKEYFIQPVNEYAEEYIKKRL